MVSRFVIWATGEAVGYMKWFADAVAQAKRILLQIYNENNYLLRLYNKECTIPLNTVFLLKFKIYLNQREIKRGRNQFLLMKIEK